MQQIKLEGFRIFSDHHVLPIYSYTCPCGIKVYLEDFISDTNRTIFKTKYFKNFRELVKGKTLHKESEYMKKIPHVEIKINKICTNHPIKFTPSDYKPANLYVHKIYYNPQYRNIMDELYQSLLESDDFKIGSWLGRFALNYWVTGQHSWFDHSNFSATLEQKKIFISEAAETKLLDKINQDLQKYLNEINKALPNIITPLRKVICEYNYSALHFMGVLIAQFKSDIEKYID
ncbi:MAG: hypothetical protein Harvfovirus5_13 [Harvfovirus sp.]|uniref:Uncharacterized protein n=1 Tax=Harvfovirus sp. TaxID=2487768 RepID=A0A3G5A5E0_9VIRU|nr:MAG: hypothetical protein Harvfovirus5_13 [Harvfovirus sp.]